MQMCTSNGVSVCLEYQSKHDRLRQRPDYIVYAIALILIVS